MNRKVNRKNIDLVVIVQHKKSCYPVVLDEREMFNILDLIEQMHDGKIKLHKEKIEGISLVAN